MLKHFTTFLKSKGFRSNSTFEHDSITYTVTKEEDGDRPAELEVSGTNQYMTAITVPDDVFGCLVTSLGREAFMKHPSVKTVSIGKNVRRIGDRCFSSASCLRRVYLPDGLGSIGTDAFSDCALLNRIVIPDTVKSIGAGAFRNCRNLDTATLPVSLSSIESETFENCSYLTTIVIPGSVRSIADDAFLGCSKLGTVSVDAGSECFCSDSQGMLYDRNRTELMLCPPAIGNDAVIPDSVTRIRTNAFRGYGRDRIRIPNSVAFVEEGAFDFPFLKGPSGVGLNLSDIRGYDYVYSNDMKGFMRIGQSINSVSVSPVEEFSFERIGDDLFGKPLYGVSGYNGTDGSPELPVSHDGCRVSAICDSAFRGNGVLKNVKIPSGYTSIGRSAFSGCTSLVSVDVPETITAIPEEAFRGCTSLKDIGLHRLISRIGDSAFRGCTSMESFRVPEDTASIDDSAFMDCSGLSGIVFPKGLKDIRSKAFSGCRSLSEVDMPAGLNYLDFLAFDHDFCRSNGERISSEKEMAGRSFVFDDAKRCYVLSDGHDRGSMKKTHIEPVTSPSTSGGTGICISSVKEEPKVRTGIGEVPSSIAPTETNANSSHRDID